MPFQTRFSESSSLSESTIALLAQMVEAADLRSVMSEFESLGEHQFHKASRNLEHLDLVSDGMNDGCNPSALGSIPSEVLNGKCPVGSRTPS
jgi:hypothetical protein